jgi:hypothetical protein
LLVVGEDEYSIPIVVINLAALQVDPFVTKYDLAALIALLSRRISVARLRQLVTQQASHEARPLLEELFGEGFTPTDIFRMFLSLARELADPDPLTAGLSSRLAAAYRRTRRLGDDA